jgi:hypothetical protein
MNRIRHFFIGCVLFLGVSNSGLGQKILLPFDRVTSQDANRQLYETDSIIHLSFKPLLLEKSEYDSIISHTHNRYSGKEYGKWFGRKLYRENLAIISSTDFYLTIDPVFNFEVGKDFADNGDELLTTNSRGILVQGNITKKIYFRTDFYETQSYFPVYVDSMIKSTTVVPGQGRRKGFKDGGADYPVVTGIVNYQATKNLNLQFGQDKMFIGNGYRSLLLSDNSAPFLFFQAGLNLFKNKLNYHANWASLQTLEKVHQGNSTGDDLFAKKQANFNYLSYKPNSMFEIGVFEGVMWETWNPQTGSQPFDAVFLNPIPFLTTALKSNDTLTSSLLGLNTFVKPFQRVGFYWQLSYNVQKTGIGNQVGVKWYDAFSVKGFNLQSELNIVEQGVYGTQNKYTDYFSYNQPLATQQMEDYSELLLIANYRYKRILVYGKGSFVQTGMTLQDGKRIQNYDLNVAYLFNPMTNLMINVGVRYRNEETVGSTNWVYFGMKTNLRNLYYDF